MDNWIEIRKNKFTKIRKITFNLVVDLGLIVTPHSQIDFSIWKKANVKVLDLSANSNNYGWPKFL